MRDQKTREIRCEILSETLWILNNLTHELERDFDERLFTEFNIQQTIQAHLLENFIEDIDGDKGMSEVQFALEDHYPVVAPLTKYELRLLKELVWL